MKIQKNVCMVIGKNLEMILWIINLKLNKTLDFIRKERWNKKLKLIRTAIKKMKILKKIGNKRDKKTCIIFKIKFKKIKWKFKKWNKN